MSTEYINKEYYYQIPYNERHFIKLTQAAAYSVIEKLKAEGIPCSATVSPYRSTVTVNQAHAERAEAIAKEIVKPAQHGRIIIGNTEYRNIRDRRYIETDSATAMQIANLLAGNAATKFSGVVYENGKATVTVSGDKTAAEIRRLIDNINNMDLLESLNKAGYERIADKNGFVNIRNTATGEICGFSNMDMVRDMWNDPANEFFHSMDYRIEYAKRDMDLYYISQWAVGNEANKTVYRDGAGKALVFRTVDEAVAYVQNNEDIFISNPKSEIDMWQENDRQRESREKAAELRKLTGNFPMQNGMYPDHISFDKDSGSFTWTYFNPDGDNGNGAFVEKTVFNDDVFNAYRARIAAQSEEAGRNAFMEYLNSCAETVIDTNDPSFAAYAEEYINPKISGVSVLYGICENSKDPAMVDTVIRVMEDSSPEVAGDKARREQKRKEDEVRNRNLNVIDSFDVSSGIYPDVVYYDERGGLFTWIYFDEDMGTDGALVERTFTEDDVYAAYQARISAADEENGRNAFVTEIVRNADKAVYSVDTEEFTECAERYIHLPLRGEAETFYSINEGSRSPFNIDRFIDVLENNSTDVKAEKERREQREETEQDFEKGITEPDSEAPETDSGTEYPENVFAYGGYHFVPVNGKAVDLMNSDFRQATKNLRHNTEINNYGLNGNYDYDDFYRSSGSSEADIFECVETGKKYIPGENELFEYVGVIEYAPAKDEWKLSADSKDFVIDGQEGTWHVTDTAEINGRKLFEVESDNYGYTPQVGHMIIDSDENVIADNVHNGFLDIPVQSENKRMVFLITDGSDTLYGRNDELSVSDFLRLTANSKFFRMGEMLKSNSSTIDIARFAEISQSENGMGIEVDINDNTVKIYGFDTLVTYSLDDVTEKYKESPIHFGLFGNGITVYDTSREIDHDYPTVAHISPEGIINYRGNYNIGEDDIRRIEEQAAKAKQEFTEMWNKLDNSAKYHRIMDSVTPDMFIAISSMNLDVYDVIKEFEHSAIFKDEPFPDMETLKEKYAHSYRDIPLYTQSFLEANAEDEIDLYRISEEENIACARAIDKYSAKFYKEYSFDPEAALEAVLAEFPAERVEYVVAANIANENFDRRLSRENVSWAESYMNDLPEEYRRVSAIYLNTHKGLLDMFASAVREYMEHSMETPALAEAKKYISDFIKNEFGSTENFSNLHDISLGYTTLGDNEEYEFQVKADLIDLTVTYYIDDEIISQESYGTLKEMNAETLSALNFDELVSVGTDELNERGKLFAAEEKKIVGKEIDVDTAVLMWENGLDVFADGKVIDRYDFRNYDNVIKTHEIFGSEGVTFSAEETDIETNALIDTVAGAAMDFSSEYVSLDYVIGSTEWLVSGYDGDPYNRIRNALAVGDFQPIHDYFGEVYEHILKDDNDEAMRKWNTAASHLEELETILPQYLGRDSRTAYYYFPKGLSVWDMWRIRQQSSEYAIAAPTLATDDEFLKEHNIHFYKIGRDIGGAFESVSKIFRKYDDLSDRHLLETAKELSRKAGKPFTEFTHDDVPDRTEEMFDRMKELYAADVFQIYQVKSGDEYHYKRFAHLNELDEAPNIGDYDLVYTGNISDHSGSGNIPEDLGKIFIYFNMNRPADYKGRSLSVSDVLLLHGDTPYYVDGSDYSLLSGDFLKSRDTEKITEQEAISHPDIIKDLGLESDSVNFSVVSFDGEKDIVVSGYVDKEDVTELDEYADYEDRENVSVRIDNYIIGSGESEDADEEQVAYIQAHLNDVLKKATPLDYFDFTAHNDIDGSGLDEDKAYIYSEIEFETGEVYYERGEISDDNINLTAAYKEITDKYADPNNIEDLYENIRVTIHTYRYGSGEDTVPNDEEMENIRDNITDIMNKSDLVEQTEFFSCFWKNTDDFIYDLAEIAGKQHRENPTVGDAYLEHSYLYPENPDNEHPDFYTAVLQIKLTGREWLPTEEAIKSMYKDGGIDFSRIEMLNVSTVHFDGIAGEKDMTPEMFSILLNRSEKNIEQYKEAARNLQERIDRHAAPMPLYTKDAAAATESGESEQYFANLKENRECAKSIDYAVTVNRDYEESTFDPNKTIIDLMQRYSLDRIIHVIAASVKSKSEWDSRISNKNAQWAKNQLAELSDRAIRLTDQYGLSSHSVFIDDLAEILRTDYERFKEIEEKKNHAPEQSETATVQSAEEKTETNIPQIGDIFRDRTGDMWKVVSLTGAVPFRTDLCGIENISDKSVSYTQEEKCSRLLDEDVYTPIPEKVYQLISKVDKELSDFLANAADDVSEYEKDTKKDLAGYIRYNTLDLSDRQLDALLSCGDTLYQLYDEWLGKDYDEYEDIEYIISDTADALLISIDRDRAEQERKGGSPLENPKQDKKSGSPVENPTAKGKTVDELAVGDLIRYNGETWAITKIDGDFSLSLDNIDPNAPLQASGIWGHWKERLTESGFEYIPQTEINAEMTADYEPHINDTVEYKGSDYRITDISGGMLTLQEADNLIPKERRISIADFLSSDYSVISKAETEKPTTEELFAQAGISADNPPTVSPEVEAEILEQRMNGISGSGEDVSEKKYADIKNLAQLKRALTVGAEFELTSPARKVVNQIRRVNYADTTGIYSIRPDAPDDKNTTLANNGRGSYLDWGKSANWEFSNGICTLYGKGMEHTKENILLSLSVIQPVIEHERNAEKAAPAKSVSEETQKAATVNIRSAAISNYEGMVAFVGADKKVYIGKDENYDNHGNYDNSDNSLVFISDNEKMFGFLNGEGWVLSQQEMLDNGLFTNADYAEFSKLRDTVLTQFNIIREVTFKGEPFVPVSYEDTPEKGSKSPSKSKPLFRSVTIDLTPKERRQERTVTPEKVPEAPKGKNYVITDENYGAAGGDKARYALNVEAIKTLKAIEAENRSATPEEQEILAKYTGWGAIPQVFDESNDKWSKEYNELFELLTPAEYHAARKSTMNAHYTSPTVISAIYDALDRLGFDGGKILEPAMGIGNFFGRLPEVMRGSSLYGVELDSLTGRIAQQLYPNAHVQITGFEKTEFPDSSFDVAIGNVPFGDYRLNDKRYNDNNFLIHDYFFAKAIDKVHPGGIVAFVTSKGTMDKVNDEIRKYIAQRAEMLGAIRLPNNAFKETAGTEVTSDIIFLQKRERPIEINPEETEWIGRSKTADGLSVNSYFVNHPEMVLGTITAGNKLYGNQENTTSCIPIEGADLKQQLAEAVKNINGTYRAAEYEIAPEDKETIPAPANSRKFSFQLYKGSVYYREADSTMRMCDFPKDRTNRLIGMIGLRDNVHELLNLQLNNSDGSLDGEIAKSREKLNKAYDSFVAKYGHVSDRKNARAMKGDNGYNIVSALETKDEKGKVTGKADIFTKNTVKPKIIAEHVDTAEEALILSVSEKGKVDFEFMTELCGKDKDSLIAALDGQIYKLPTEDRYVTADEYLTGNIRKKMAEITSLPKEEALKYEKNYEALKAALPPRVEAKDISVKLGAHWVYPKYVQQFIMEILKPDYKTEDQMNVQYSAAAGAWKIEGVSATAKRSYEATKTFGTERMHAYEIIEGILNNSNLQVKDRVKDEYGRDVKDSNGRYVLVVNEEETKAVRQCAKLIQSEFKEWIFQDPERREELVQRYNEVYNSIRQREYDGSHLNFVGMNPEIKLREHQLNAIARGLYGGNTMLAHAVGAGKSATRS